VPAGVKQRGRGGARHPARDSPGACEHLAERRDRTGEEIAVGGPCRTLAAPLAAQRERQRHTHLSRRAPRRRICRVTLPVARRESVRGDVAFTVLFETTSLFEH
jgi:hypothetical protein